MSIRIVIADDHGVLRAGLRALLSAEPDIEVAADVGDGYQLLDVAKQVRPDIVLLDISMPGPGGVELIRQLRRSQPDLRVLILTVHEDEGLLQEAIAAGAAGYVIKRAVESELINAIHAVHRGDIYIHPAMTRALLRDVLPPREAKEPPREPLSPREIEVLKLIALGYTNRQIAEALTISVRTVESHRANIRDKLGLHSRVDLVRYAREHGLIQ
ncbi:MAG: response regulator transcription factor [Anaerolineae bacterium]